MEEGEVGEKVAEGPPLLEHDEEAEIDEMLLGEAMLACMDCAAEIKWPAAGQLQELGNCACGTAWTTSYAKVSELIEVSPSSSAKRSKPATDTPKETMALVAEEAGLSPERRRKPSSTPRGSHPEASEYGSAGSRASERDAEEAGLGQTPARTGPSASEPPPLSANEMNLGDCHAPQDGEASTSAVTEAPTARAIVPVATSQAKDNSKKPSKGRGKPKR